MFSVVIRTTNARDKARILQGLAAYSKHNYQE
jgi:hypothetical protein